MTAPLVAMAALGVATTQGCRLRWGTPHDGPLPSRGPATDLIVAVDDPTVANACERVGAFGRVLRETDAWPAAGGPAPHPPDAWIEARVDPEPADGPVVASWVYAALAIAPFVASLGFACPLVLLRNERLVLVARGPRPDEAWVRGPEVARVAVRYREGVVVWVAAPACGEALSAPAPLDVLDGGLRLLARALAGRPRPHGRSAGPPGGGP